MFNSIRQLIVTREQKLKMKIANALKVEQQKQAEHIKKIQTQINVIGEIDYEFSKFNSKTKFDILKNSKKYAALASESSKEVGPFHMKDKLPEFDRDAELFDIISHVLPKHLRHCLRKPASLLVNQRKLASQMSSFRARDLLHTTNQHSVDPHKHQPTLETKLHRLGSKANKARDACSVQHSRRSSSKEDGLLFRSRKETIQNKEEPSAGSQQDIVLGKNNKEAKVPDLKLSKLASIHKEASASMRIHPNTTRNFGDFKKGADVFEIGLE